MWIAEFGSGALASIQSSYVTVGNYPGIEARIYGSEGAIIVRLVDEFGCCQTIKTARKDAVEFTDAEIPQSSSRRAAHSGEPWEFLFYSNLVTDFIDEITDGGLASQGDFAQGALVQETINAFEESSRDAAGSASTRLPARARRGQVPDPCSDQQRRAAGPPGAGRGGLAAAGRPARLPGRPGRPGLRCCPAWAGSRWACTAATRPPATPPTTWSRAPSVRHRDPARQHALQFLTCVGNAVRVESGPAAGAVGHVIGQHAYVLVDFAEPTAAQVTTGDEVTVMAVGQGLALADHPAIVVKNCSPGLLAALPGGTGPDGRLEVHVAARVPAEAIGAGAGMVSEYANTDLMGAYAGPRRGSVPRPGGAAHRRHRGAGRRRPPVRPRLPARST